MKNIMIINSRISYFIGLLIICFCVFAKDPVVIVNGNNLEQMHKDYLSSFNKAYKAGLELQQEMSQIQKPDTENIELNIKTFRAKWLNKHLDKDKNHQHNCSEDNKAPAAAISTMTGISEKDLCHFLHDYSAFSLGKEMRSLKPIENKEWINLFINMYAPDLFKRLDFNNLPSVVQTNHAMVVALEKYKRLNLNFLMLHTDYMTELKKQLEAATDPIIKSEITARRWVYWTIAKGAGSVGYLGWFPNNEYFVSDQWFKNSKSKIIAEKIKMDPTDLSFIEFHMSPAGLRDLVKTFTWFTNNEELAAIAFGERISPLTGPLD